MEQPPKQSQDETSYGNAAGLERENRQKYTKQNHIDGLVLTTKKATSSKKNPPLPWLSRTTTESYQNLTSHRVSSIPANACPRDQTHHPNWAGCFPTRTHHLRTRVRTLRDRRCSAKALRALDANTTANSPLQSLRISVFHDEKIYTYLVRMVRIHRIRVFSVVERITFLVIFISSVSPRTHSCRTTSTSVPIPTVKQVQPTHGEA